MCRISAAVIFGVWALTLSLPYKETPSSAPQGAGRDNNNSVEHIQSLQGDAGVQVGLFEMLYEQQQQTGGD